MLRQSWLKYSYTVENRTTHSINGEPIEVTSTVPLSLIISGWWETVCLMFSSVTLVNHNKIVLEVSCFTFDQIRQFKKKIIKLFGFFLFFLSFF